MLGPNCLFLLATVFVAHFFFCKFNNMPRPPSVEALADPEEVSEDCAGDERRAGAGAEERERVAERAVRLDLEQDLWGRMPRQRSRDARVCWMPQHV